jgi:prepilin-type N-terminal cleavage/methylation domain-containing protein/prepilin-type processing-associated H-X9-DG protein
MRKKQKIQTLNGFTLIEMLVVIAIIALLAAIIVPSVSSSMHRARTARGMSNLRQIGQAFLLYANDHDGLLPFEQGPEGVPETRTWHISISPYLDGMTRNELEARTGRRPLGVFACPNSDNLTRSGNYADYGMNIYINETHANQGGVQRRIYSIPSPERVILAGDSENVNRGLRPGHADGTALLDVRQGVRRDSANILYVDGRVSTERRTELTDIQGNRMQQHPWGWPGFVNLLQ